MVTRCFVLILVLLLTNCLGDDGPVDPPVALPVLQLLDSGNVIGYPTYYNQVFRSDEELNDFLNRYLENPFNIPGDIDFSVYNVLIFFDDVKNNTGFSLELEYEENSDTLNTTFIHKFKEGGQELTNQPYVIIKILKNKSIDITHQAVPPLIYYETMLKGNINQPFIPQQNLLINTREEWLMLLSDVHIEDIEQLDNINFNEYMILAVIDQVQPTCCNSIDITKITETESQIVVEIYFLLGGIQHVIAQPAHVVKIPRTNKEIIFNFN